MLKFAYIKGIQEVIFFLYLFTTYFSDGFVMNMVLNWLVHLNLSKLLYVKLKQVLTMLAKCFEIQNIYFSVTCNLGDLCDHIRMSNLMSKRSKHISCIIQVEFWKIFIKWLLRLNIFVICYKNLLMFSCWIYDHNYIYHFET